MTPLVATGEALIRLHGVFSTFVNSQGILPKVDSPAHAEQQGIEHPESIRTVVAQVNQLIEVAGDHLTAFVKTITEPVETIAPWTCVRAILEATAVAVWLLDPSIKAKERVGRSLALRYEGLEQQGKYCRLTDAVVARQVEERIVEMENQAVSWGFSLLRGRDGRRVGIGVPMPSSTSLIGSALNDEGMYRLLSGVAHAHFWAVYPLSFSVALAADAESTAGYLVSGKQVNVLGMRALAATGAGAVGRVGWFQSSFYGWERLELRRRLEPIFDELAVPTQKRPWS